MKVLLDTHAMLCFLTDDPQLSSRGRAVIEDAGNEVHVSPASYWELAIKIGLRKISLTIAEPFDVFIEREIADNDFRVLHIEPKHVGVLTTLPHQRRNPFDRMIIAQAMIESMPIVTIDRAFHSYPVGCIW